MSEYWNVFYMSYGKLLCMSVKGNSEEQAKKEFYRIKGEPSKYFYIDSIKNHEPSYNSMFSESQYRLKNKKE